MTQESHADRDAFTAGRDLNIFNQQQPPWKDGVVLDVLSASGGAQLLKEWCANEATFNGAAFLLVTASVAGAAEALKVLLAADADLVVALLARISVSKAVEVISAITPHDSWLEQLPTAAHEITQCEIGKSADLGPRKGRLTRALASIPGTDGYVQLYERGLIHWSPRAGAQATASPIAEYHRRLGGSGGPLGFPVSEELSTGRSISGTTGRYQRFESVSDYDRQVCDLLGLRCGGTVYWSEEYGPHGTFGGIGELYELNAGTAGWLGFPLEEASKVGPYFHGGIAGYRQEFEGGAIYSSAKTGAVAVSDSVAEYMENGDPDAVTPIGFPVGPQREAIVSPYGTSGRLQRFEGVRDYPQDVLDHLPGDSGPCGATVYSSIFGIYTVGGDIGALYERLGGTRSELGFPVSEETGMSDLAEPERWEDREGFIQEFEGGAIFRQEGHSPVPVSAEIWNYLTDNEPTIEELGFPVSGEVSLSSEGDMRMQRFEDGIITINGSLIEAWTHLPVREVTMVTESAGAPGPEHAAHRPLFGPPEFQTVPVAQGWPEAMPAPASFAPIPHAAPPASAPTQRIGPSAPPRAPEPPSAPEPWV